MADYTFRRKLLDQHLSNICFRGKVLDIGGKKERRRGSFIPPVQKTDCWHYVNLDPATNPDYLCDAAKLPMAAGQYDIVLLCEVLEHVPAPELVIAEAYRVLADRGRLFISMPFLSGLHADPEDYQRWTGAQLGRVLRKIGFGSAEIIPMGGPFSVVYDMLYPIRNMFSIPFVMKIILKAIAPFILWLDHLFIQGRVYVTTGYWVEAHKTGS